MNNIEFNKLGGLPVTQHTLGFMQESNASALAALAFFLGDRTILYGVEVVGSQVTNGWVSYNGELVEFEGGLLLDNVAVVETKQQRSFQDGISKDVYVTRKMKCVLTGGILFSELKKLALVPKGVINMWSGDVANIPAGWALCNGANGTPNLSGMFIVGYNAADSDYDAIGKTGGEKTLTLQRANLPHFQLSINTGDRKGRSDDANDRDVMIPGADGTSTKYTDYLGDSVPFDKRPSFYTLAYIIKL